MSTENPISGCPDHDGDMYEDECDVCRDWWDAQAAYWSSYFKKRRPSQDGPHILSPARQHELKAIEVTRKENR